MFVENLIDNSIEKSINRNFLKRLKQKTFTEGIKILKKSPDEGMKYLVVIEMEELRLNQNFNDKQQYEFYEVLLNSFFPGYSVSDFIPNRKI